MSHAAPARDLPPLPARPTGATRRPTACSTARSRGSGPRPTTGCTRRGACCCSSCPSRASGTEASGARLRVNKPQRQHLIAKLLEDHQITNQAQLVELLAADGIEVNQATVSRDLEELGAIKVRVPGGETAYAIPELPKRAGRARGPPAAGAGRLGGRGDALRRPRGACAPRRGRPTWWRPRIDRSGVGRRPRHRRRRRHAAGHRRPSGSGAAVEPPIRDLAGLG